MLVQLGAWGKQWLESELDRDHLDAGLLMWDMQRRIVRESLPSRRVVVSFHFPDAPPRQRRFWLVLEPDAVDLCLDDPGLDADLALRSDVTTLTRVWLGDQTLARALELGRIKLTGPADLRRRLPSWLGLSLFAAYPRRRDRG